MATVGTPAIEENGLVDESQRYRTPYPACPLCGSPGFTVFAAASCKNHPAWHAPLPESLTWLLCDSCKHIFTDSFYTEAGLTELFRKAHPSQLAGGDLDRQRMLWAPVIQMVLQALPDRSRLLNGNWLSWLDVGCGAGGLVFTADEFGFTATGIDLREEAVRRIRELGYHAQQADLLSVQCKTPLNVISMADLLEHTPYPVAILRHARQLLDANGVLYLSCPNRDCSSWRQMDIGNSNPYWGEMEHYHNFSRRSLMGLLRDCGFLPAAYSVSNRYIACMEIVAVKASPAIQAFPEIL
ncbi:MAG: class I SAM-dependent methyltransferase [Terracidiphilus sp.]